MVSDPGQPVGSFERSNILARTRKVQAGEIPERRRHYTSQTRAHSVLTGYCYLYLFLIQHGKSHLLKTICEMAYSTVVYVLTGIRRQHTQYTSRVTFTGYRYCLGSTIEIVHNPSFPALVPATCCFSNSFL